MGAVDSLARQLGMMRARASLAALLLSACCSEVDAVEDLFYAKCTTDHECETIDARAFCARDGVCRTITATRAPRDAGAD